MMLFIPYTDDFKVPTYHTRTKGLTVFFELQGVDVTMDSMEMVELPVVPAQIDVVKVKEIVTVMQIAEIILDVGWTIATLALDFLQPMTVVIMQV